MFTGIVESTGKVMELLQNGSNRTFWIESPLASQLKIDQSIAHDGVCLTIEEITDSRHRVTAVAETLDKSNLGNWQPGKLVNLERSLIVNGRLDGHFVQGHVDCTAELTKIKERDGSHELEFDFPKKWAALVIEKGSIAINGISLTAFDVKKSSFRVAIIPYTWQYTNLKELVAGDKVNIEFDMMGKYIQRHMQLK